MTAAVSDVPILDVAYLDDMRRWIGDDTMIALLANAPASFRDEVTRIDEGWRAGDLNTVREGAHRLKGSAGSVACRRLSSLGQDVQLIAALDDRTVFDALQTEADRAIAALTTYSASIKADARPD